jgi:hypothetical protein
MGFSDSTSEVQVIEGEGSVTGSNNKSAFMVAGVGPTNSASFLKTDANGFLKVSGSFTATTAAEVSGAVDQGLAGTQAEGWFIKITDGAQVLGTGSSAPLYITGSVTVNNPGGGGSGGTVDQGNSGSIEQSWLTSITDGTQVLGTGSSAPLFTSGSVHVQNFPPVQTVTGTVHLDNALLPVSVSNLPQVQQITGSVTLGEQPIQVTGSVVLGEEPIEMTGSVTVNSIEAPVDVTVLNDINVDVTGTVDQGLAGTHAESWLVRISDGTQTLGTGSSAPIFTSGSVHVQNFPPVQTVTGSVILGEQPILVTGSVVLGEEPIEITGSATINSIASPVTVEQGDAGTQAEGWYTRITDGTQVLGTGSSAPLFTSGSVHVQNFPPVQTVTGSISIDSGSQVIGKVQITDLVDEVTIIEDPDMSDDKRLQVEAAIKPGSSINIGAIVDNPTQLFVQQLENTGSADMIVNGSGTPQQFVVTASANENIQITELRVVYTAQSILFDGATFGKGAGALSNGIEINVIVNDGQQRLPNLQVVTINEDFLRFGSNQGINSLLAQGGVNDVLSTSFIFGGVLELKSGSADRVEMIVKDNLTAGARGLLHLQSTLFGIIQL